MTVYRVLMIAALSLTACGGTAEEQAATTNVEFKVERLFTYDGCTAYRFEDARTVYYVRCGREVSTFEEHREACGKNCTRVRRTQVQTVEEPSP